MLDRLQYRNAKELQRQINKSRPPKESFFRSCLNTTAFAFFAPIRILDWTRRSGSSSSSREGRTLRQAELRTQMDDINLPWTMEMAFYALSGGCIYRSKDGDHFALQKPAIVWLAESEPETLLPLQRAVLQSLGRANGIAKAVTCVQALWFCSQCIARLGDGLAVSLLELNTFAHCVSALLIYMFWWEKPYEVESHVLIENPVLGLAMSFAVTRPSLWLWTKEIPTDNELTVHDQQSFCDVKVETGNVLVSATSRIGLLSDLPLSHERLLRSPEGEALQIPDTGFYLIIKDGVVENADYHMDEDDLSSWRTVWQSWVDLNFPIPSSAFTGIPRSAWHARHISNMDSNLAELITTADEGILIPLVMALTFGAYGGLHLLAWHYNFGTKAENLLWKIASIMTASTGVILLAMILGEEMELNAAYLDRERRRITLHNFISRPRRWMEPLWMVHAAGLALKTIAMVVALANIIARAFLVVESLKALPNSPPSTYVVPNWAAYFPHI